MAEGFIEFGAGIVAGKMVWLKNQVAVVAPVASIVRATIVRESLIAWWTFGHPEKRLQHERQDAWNNNSLSRPVRVCVSPVAQGSCLYISGRMLVHRRSSRVQ